VYASAGGYGGGSLLALTTNSTKVISVKIDKAATGWEDYLISIYLPVGPDELVIREDGRNKNSIFIDSVSLDAQAAAAPDSCNTLLLSTMAFGLAAFYRKRTRFP
jgi:hypothetical protein